MPLAERAVRPFARALHRTSGNALWFAIIAAVASVQCTSSAPRSQVLVFIDTDAPVPQDLGWIAAADPDRALPLVDVARIEILDRATGLVACDECRRDIPLDEKKLADHRVSFGIVHTAHPLDVRVRMFLLQQVGAKTEPPASITIETRSQLAGVDEGVVSQSIFLPSDTWGASHPTADPPQIGEPPPSRVGTWPKAQPARCTRPSRPDGPLFDGERCVPGGAFTRSNRGLELYSAPDASPLTEPRLVALSPFLMDRYEYTVGRYVRDSLAIDAPPPWYNSQRLPGAGSVLVDEPGDERLARPSFAFEEDVHVTRRQPRDKARELGGGRGRAEECAGAAERHRPERRVFFDDHAKPSRAGERGREDAARHHERAPERVWNVAGRRPAREGQRSCTVAWHRHAEAHHAVPLVSHRRGDRAILREVESRVGRHRVFDAPCAHPQLQLGDVVDGFEYLDEGVQRS